MMTQIEYEQRVLAAKKKRTERIAAARREHEVAAADIRRRRERCSADAKFIDELRNKYIKSAHEEYRLTHDAIQEEWQAQLEAQRKAGLLTYNDFLDAVKIIHRFLKQADNDGIVIPWGTGSAEIRFKAAAIVEQEGGEA